MDEHEQKVQSGIFIKKRFHLNRWYHRLFGALVIFQTWNTISYLSYIDWMMSTIFIIFSGYLFLTKHLIWILKTVLYSYGGFLLIVQGFLIKFIWDSNYNDDQVRQLLTNRLDYHFSKTMFGQRTVFAQLFEQLIIYSLITGLLTFILPNLEDTENQGMIIQHSPQLVQDNLNDDGRFTFAHPTPLLIEEPNPSQHPIINADQIIENGDDEVFTFRQQRVSYDRQFMIIERYMLLVVILIILNEGLFVFCLMLCFIVYLAIYYHAIENVDRFKISRVLNFIIMILSMLSLYSVLFPSMTYFGSNHQDKCFVIIGTLLLNKIIRVIVLICLIILLMMTVRTFQYHTILKIQEVKLVDLQIERERMRQQDKNQNVSSIHIFICQNYFGVIILLSMFWITKQFSVFRGLVFILIIMGMIKRQRFKARKRWQTSIIILYVSSFQFILLVFYNIPVIFLGSNHKTIFHFFGMYELPKYETTENYRLTTYFWERLGSVIVDLVYIITLTYLVYSQQTLDDQRRNLQIKDLVNQKRQLRRSTTEKSFWMSLKNELTTFFKEVKRTFLMHFDKLVIFLCLLISLQYQADVVRATFLLFFIIYAFQDLHDRKRYMRAQLILNFFILFLLYMLELIFINNLNVLDTYAQGLGLNEFFNTHTSIPFYFAYQFYDIIIGTLLLVFQIQVIYKTETLTKYKKNIQKLDESQQEEQTEFMQRSTSDKEQLVYKVFMMLDPLKRIFIRNGVVICQLALLLVAFIPPANLSSLVYIIFYQACLYLIFLHGSGNHATERLVAYIHIIIGLSIFIITVRYMYTIALVNYLVQMLIDEQTLLSDLGLDPNLNTFKLVANGLVLQLLASYRRLYRSKIFMFLKLHYDAVSIEDKKRILDHRFFSYSWYCFKTKVSIFLLYHLQKLMFIFAFYIAIYQQSYIGAIFAALIFVIIFREMSNNWINISVPFMIILTLQILIQYIFQTSIFQNLLHGDELINWIGIFDQSKKKYWTLMILLHTCELIPLLYSICQFQVRVQLERYMIDPAEREIAHLKQITSFIIELQPNYLLVKKRRDNQPIQDDSESEKLSQNEQESITLESNKSSQSFNAENHETELKVLCDPNHTVEQRLRVLMQYFQVQRRKVQYREYLAIMPIHQSLKTHEQIDRFFTQIGLEICLFFMVITAYYQRNFFSVFYIIVASIFANFSSYLQKSSYGQGVKTFKFALTSLCVLMMLEVMRKYSILQWTPSSWDIRKPWWYWTYTCDERGKSAFNEKDPLDNVSDFMKCQQDWNYWLSLNGYTHFDIWVTFFSFMFTICFLRHFSTIEKQQKEQQRHDEESQKESSNKTDTSDFDSEDVLSDSSKVQETDQQDFTHSKNRKTLGDYLKFYIFCYFYKLPLIVFLLIGVSSDISSYTEVISCLYFFISINLLYRSEYLESKKHGAWDLLILFNTIIMILMSLYQAPFVPCPVIYEAGRYYYDNTECVIIQQTNHYYNSQFFIFLQDEFQQIAEAKNQDQEGTEEEEIVSTFEVFYMFASHILGLNKTLNFRLGFSRETLMALFFLLGLIQRNIWQHEYTKKFVEPYLLRQKEKQKQAAIELVEGIHLRRMWDFKYQQAQKDCHDSMQARVSARVKRWDEFFHFDQNRKLSFFNSIEQKLDRREEVRLLRYEEGQAEENQRIHDSFTSQEFNQLKLTDEKKIIEAEQIVQNNRAPVIQLYDACAVVKKADKDLVLLDLLIQELKLLEEKRLLEEVYLNEKIGLFQYYERMMVTLSVQLHRITESRKNYKGIEQVEQKEKVEKSNSSSPGRLEEGDSFKSDRIDLPERPSIMEGSRTARLLDTQQEESKEVIVADSQQIIFSQIEPPQRDELVENQDSDDINNVTLSKVSSDSLPDQEVALQQPTSGDLKQLGDATDDQLKQQKKKHSALVNLWLTFKLYLRETLVGILTQDTYLRASLIKREEISRKRLSVLIFYFIGHYFVIICALMMLIDTCYNANILALIMPLSMFLYGMVENPVQTKRYWNFLLVYIITIISLKFIYQMPIFCDSPPYTFIGFSDGEACEPRVATINEKITRIDYVLGIRKYNSAEGETFLKNVWIDLVLLIFFLIQRFLLQSQGIWDHVRLNRDRYYIPQFKESSLHKMTQINSGKIEEEKVDEVDENDDFSEKSKLLRDNTLQNQEEEEQKVTTLQQHVSLVQKDTSAAISNFFYRVFPTFLPLLFVNSYWKRYHQAQRMEEEEKQASPLGGFQVQRSIIIDSANQLDQPPPIASQTNLRRNQQFSTLTILNPKEDRYKWFSSSGHDVPQGEWKLEKKEAVMFPEQIKTGRDIYVPGFIICFIILVYFLIFFPNIISKRSYAHITQGKSQRFSSEVIFVLLLVITIIVVDRMLFIIRKVTKNPKDIQALMLEHDEEDQQGDFSKYTLLIKASMHVMLLFLVHYYFFFVIPRKTNRRIYFLKVLGFQESPYLIFAYLLIFIYFIISTLQIKYGYPVSEINQVFTSSKERVNSTAFQVYRAIPFLYELRIIIDWTFTTTSLDLIQWFKLEDIYASLYICQVYMYDRLKSHKLGHKRTSTEKCCSGFCYALILIFIIILPILIFSSLNPAVEINNAQTGRLTIKAAFNGQDEKLFFTLFQINDVELHDLQADQFKSIQKVYGEIESSWQDRMQKIRVKRFSDTEWNLPENYRDQIRRMIKSQEYEVEVECDWVFVKSDKNGGSKTYSGFKKVKGQESFVNNFGKILSPKSPDTIFDIEKIIPKFVYVGESAETEILRLEPVNIRNEPNSYYQDVRLIHRKTGDQVFFELVPIDKQSDLKQIGALESGKVEFFILNELTFGSIIGAMSDNVSIIGIYATFVLAVGRFIRLTYDKISMRVTYEEMPQVSELFDLCQSIYIARVDGNLKKEEIFYELLIRIYRSPEILFKMTGSSIYDKNVIE